MDSPDKLLAADANADSKITREVFDEMCIKIRP
jgi:hypothetical protein